MFRITALPIDPSAWSARVQDPGAGAVVSFEGRVRDHADGRRVLALAYEAYEALAVKEGDRILAEAAERFAVRHVACVHRVGSLAIGDLAVWVGASAAHRTEAFDACRYVIDELKRRVPIWKKETYADGEERWVATHPAEGVPSR